MKHAKPRRRRGVLAVLIAVVAFALLIVILNWVVMPLVVGRGRETTVPNVVGLDRFAAEESLIKAGLRLGDVRSSSNATVPADRVVTQHPEPGQRVKLGRQVHLDVSRGGSRLKVPHVEGLTLARATGLLSESGLAVAGVESLRTPSLPPGQVVATRPPAGVEVDQNERIFIQIAARVGNFPMPNLVGMSLETAQGIVASQGLTLGEVKRAPSDEPAGNVLIQYPEEGMTVRDLDTVSLIVAAATGKK
jgi:eukaryotic-like serine/threonine-protein kinase